jgi:hypothetical protein
VFALALAFAAAAAIGALSGCADLLGANFDDGHLKESPDGGDAGAAPPGEAGSGPTDDGGDAGDAGAPQVVMFGGGLITGSESVIDTRFDDTWTWDGHAWTKRTVTPHPSARVGHAMATLGRTVVLFGGEGNDLQPLGDTWVWDGARWEEKHPAHSPAPRSDAGMATVNGHVVLYGGFGAASTEQLTWTWDGTDWASAPTPASPAIFDFCMAASDGQVLAAGPSDGAANTWLYGPSWAAVSLGVLPERSGCAMTALPNQRFLLFGGRGNSGPAYGYFEDTWGFDENQKMWNRLSVSGPSPRSASAMVTFGDEALLFGGEASLDAPSVAYHDTWVFDGAAWREVPPSFGDPPARFAHAMAVIP